MAEGDAMGKRGPAPQPTAILKLRGSWLAKQREAEGEMQPEIGRPHEPTFAHDDEQRAWQQLVDQLEAIPGLLTVIDGPQLERYARYLVRWRMIESELEAFRSSTKESLLDNEMRQVLRLLWQESRAMDLHLKQIEEKFGLTPSARTRIRLGIAAGEMRNDRVEREAKRRFF